MEKDFIEIKPCKQIITRESGKGENGWLLEIVSEHDAFTENLHGQVYLTTIDVGKQKGFHVHAEAFYHVTCVRGKMKSVIHKDRDTKTEVFMGEDDFKTIKIRPGLAHLMVNVGEVPAYVVVYRFPAWHPDIREQLDILPEEVDTEVAWRKIQDFLSTFKA